jgi:hypothetical protein
VLTFCKLRRAFRAVTFVLICNAIRAGLLRDLPVYATGFPRALDAVRH